MPNEFLFFIHALVCLSFTFAALRFGKEALVVWVALQGVLANLFVLKQMEWFSLTITCSDVYVIGSILALNFTQEFYGKDAAKKATFISFFAMCFFSIVSFIHVSYTPSVHDSSQLNYAAIFTVMPKMAIISLLVFFISQRFDVMFFGLLKKWVPFSLRSALSMTVSQALDTALFTFLALRTLVEDPVAIFSVSFIIKCIVVILMTTFLQLAKICLPRTFLKAPT